jgi:hypothetical protein
MRRGDRRSAPREERESGARGREWGSPSGHTVTSFLHASE